MHSNGIIKITIIPTPPHRKFYLNSLTTYRLLLLRFQWMSIVNSRFLHFYHALSERHKIKRVQDEKNNATNLTTNHHSIPKLGTSQYINHSQEKSCFTSHKTTHDKHKSKRCNSENNSKALGQIFLPFGPNLHECRVNEGEKITRETGAKETKSNYTVSKLSWSAKSQCQEQSTKTEIKSPNYNADIVQLFNFQSPFSTINPPIFEKNLSARRTCVTLDSNAYRDPWFSAVVIHRASSEKRMHCTRTTFRSGGSVTLPGSGDVFPRAAIRHASHEQQVHTIGIWTRAAELPVVLPLRGHVAN